MALYSESTPFNGSQLCSKVDPELFFPEDYSFTTVVNKAKEVCKSCPLILPCLAYALKEPSLDGVWGGKTPQERKNLRRRMRALS